MTELIRVLITDDHFIVREGLRLILETAVNIEIVGEAADGAAAILFVAEHKPDVVLMDMRMPGMDGLTAIEHLQHDHHDVTVVILTTFNEVEEKTTVSSDPISVTERELEVLQAVATGETNKGIALQLGISERTVKAHLTSIYNKLGVDSRAAAIAVAAQKRVVGLTYGT